MSDEQLQCVLPLIGGYDDGNTIEIGQGEELPDHLEVPGNEHMHYYALECRGSTWVYAFFMSERRAVA
jgi:hypothetical protein